MENLREQVSPVVALTAICHRICSTRGAPGPGYTGAGRPLFGNRPWLGVVDLFDSGRPPAEVESLARFFSDAADELAIRQLALAAPWLDRSTVEPLPSWKAFDLAAEWKDGNVPVLVLLPDWDGTGPREGWEKRIRRFFSEVRHIEGVGSGLSLQNDILLARSFPVAEALLLGELADPAARKHVALQHPDDAPALESLVATARVVFLDGLVGATGLGLPGIESGLRSALRAETASRSSTRSPDLAKALTDFLAFGPKNHPEQAEDLELLSRHVSRRAAGRASLPLTIPPMPPSFAAETREAEPGFLSARDLQCLWRLRVLAESAR